MSEEKMLPCPACGSENLDAPTSGIMQNVFRCYKVWCHCCGASGPEGKTPADAIRAWNALPRALRWTKEPPKAAGWYWHRISPYDTIIEYVTGKRHVQVGEYAGPIPEPKEK